MRGTGHDRGGHETRDVNLSAVVWAGIAIVAVTAVAALLMIGLLAYLSGREARLQPAPTSLVRQEGPRLPPPPRLQGVPTAELETFRAEEDAELESYGWIDREAGVIRVPIDRAIDLFLEEEAR